MGLDKKILNEIKRFQKINDYIFEQDATVTEPPDALAPPPGGVTDAPLPSGTEVPPPPGGAPSNEPQPIDVETDQEVEKIDDEGKSEEKSSGESTEELDVTELVDSQKNIETKQEEYFNNLFSQLNNLESKLKDMDQIFDKLNSLETKIEKYREKTPQEKLELRTYDSYPFNQKLSDFFDDKQEEMKVSGKNDYVLTSDEVMDINADEIKNTFNPLEFDSEDYEYRQNYKFN